MDLFGWFEKLLYSMADISNWLLTPIEGFPDVINPLALVTGSGLLIYLGVAVGKWVVS